jgi:glucosamine--fructose-6-phosphate aminotransferase (isomerizing)
MCGIFGYVGEKNAIKETISGLKKLEYRGYDSAGIAYINKNNKLKIEKKVGKISVLEKSLKLDADAKLAISHTRWATHGVPNIDNCHPHCSGDFVIVHNGIIENYKQLKNDLKKENKNLNFHSDTDTEVIAKLLDFYFSKEFSKIDDEVEINKRILNSIKLTCEKLVGAWAVALINKKMSNKIYVFKNSSPLALSSNGVNSYVSSDLNAIKYKKADKITKKEKYYLLEDGDIASISKEEIVVYDKNLKLKDLNETKIKNIVEEDVASTGHHMLNEIKGIPQAISRTYDEFKCKFKIKFFKDFSKFNNIIIIGCGTAYHAGLYGKFLLEKYLKKKINVELSSEFRYNTPLIGKNDLVFAISQSGETADTIAGIKLAKYYGATTAVITNVQVSTITNLCDYVFLTNAGPEIGVAATKSYITQLFMLYLIVKSSVDSLETNVTEKLNLSLEVFINNYNKQEMYTKYIEKERFFFIGRLCDSYTACEGALKLKEIAYLHSEGYAAGELKHGTLSLVDDKTLIIAIITQENVKEKTLNAVHETRARGAKTLILSQFDIKEEGDFIGLPRLEEDLMPIVSIIPLQLLAYHISVAKNLDPDKPRNLAKSVTVE